MLNRDLGVICIGLKHLSNLPKFGFHTFRRPLTRKSRNLTHVTNNASTEHQSMKVLPSTNSFMLWEQLTELLRGGKIVDARELSIQFTTYLISKNPAFFPKMWKQNQNVKEDFHVKERNSVKKRSLKKPKKGWFWALNKLRYKYKCCTWNASNWHCHCKSKS